mmetsp:Transcript_7516/g.13544  ORF Transcript_7516/g.13544 Transcript_7516/m.13544 type:complete len:226 (+) Transcript_7516:441-1118(+)
MFIPRLPFGQIVGFIVRGGGIFRNGGWNHGIIVQVRITTPIVIFNLQGSHRLSKGRPRSKVSVNIHIFQHGCIVLFFSLLLATVRTVLLVLVMLILVASRGLLWLRRLCIPVHSIHYLENERVHNVHVRMSEWTQYKTGCRLQAARTVGCHLIVRVTVTTVARAGRKWRRHVFKTPSQRLHFWRHLHGLTRDVIHHATKSKSTLVRRSGVFLLWRRRALWRCLSL